jgi:Uma2 family endonuclease
MKPRAGKIKLSVDEYMELPNDGKRYQILDGDLDVTPAPVPRHQRLLLALLVLLQPLEAKGLFRVYPSPIDVVLDRHNVVQPDIVLIREARASIVLEKNIQGAPDLLIEILSPSTRRTDCITKKALYARFAVSHYWIVDPDLDRIEFYALDGEAFTLVETATKPDVVHPRELEGLEIPLAQVFRP